MSFSNRIHLDENKLNRLLRDLGYPKVLIVSPHRAFTGYRTFTSNLEEYFKKDRGIFLHHLILYKIPREKLYKNTNLPRGLSFIVKKIRLFFQDFFQLKKFLEENKFDVVVGVGTTLLITLVRLVSRAKYKVVSTVNLTTKRDRLFSIKTGLYFISLHLSDLVVCVSKDLTLEIKEKFKLSRKKCITIYYGIDLKKIKMRSRQKDQKISQKIEKALKAKTKKIFMMAKLHKDKDFSTLLDAFKYVVEKEKNVALFILGMGLKSELTKIKKRAKKLSIKDKIHLLGVKENPFYYLNKANIYVHTSKWEGFSFAIAEAMSLGKPIVATNAPHGPKELLGNGKYGFIVPVGQAEKVAEKILILLNKPQLYDKYSLLSKKRAQYFSIDKMGSGYETEFKRLARS